MDYDEFGEYVGGSPDIGVESEVTLAADGSQHVPDAAFSLDQRARGHPKSEAENRDSQAVVLHEDKVYHEDAQKVYGVDVEVVHYERDTQMIADPVIEPTARHNALPDNKTMPNVNHERHFQLELMKSPEHVRNIAIVGHLKHGKTSIVDVLFGHTHAIPRLGGKDEGRPFRYTDTDVLEQKRGLSLRATPVSLLLQDSRGKSFVLNAVDTPGHTDFQDELAVGLRLADGIVVTVDVIEGLLPTAKVSLEQAARFGLPAILVVNKIDRLILELRVSPEEAYLRIEYLIDQINDYASALGSNIFDPVLGNVVFTSAKHKWAFTLSSHARLYADGYNFDVDLFRRRLWGDIFYEDGKFSRTGKSRTFTHFILEPLYKLYAAVLTQTPKELADTIGELGSLPKKKLLQNTDGLLCDVATLLFPSWACLTDAVVRTIPDPSAGPSQILRNQKLGTSFSAQAVKLVPTDSTDDLAALVRVFSGNLRIGDQIEIIADGRETGDIPTLVNVEKLYVPQGRYRIEVTEVYAGSLALIPGIDTTILKTATLTTPGSGVRFAAIDYIAKPLVKVGIDPVVPRELPKMLSAARLLSKLYGALQVNTESTGEHLLNGTGELYLDTALYELREIYGKLEVKVSDPATTFRETVGEKSYVALPARTPNKANKITLLSSPLESGVVQDIRGLPIGSRELRSVLKTRHGWDSLSASSLWAFGPGPDGANILTDDTVGGDKDSLMAAKDAFVEGFNWAAAAGPLCEEPLFNVRVSVMDATFAGGDVLQSSGQIIPTVRRACHSSILVASPRLLEPTYLCTTVGPIQAGRVVYEALRKRRGRVLSDKPIPGTTFYVIEGILPIMDSFGFETDVRLAAKGQLAVSLSFQEWEAVPGDPLGAEYNVRTLEAAEGLQIARDYILKTRKRKGLSTEPVLTRYLDPEVADLIS